MSCAGRGADTHCHFILSWFVPDLVMESDGPFEVRHGGNTLTGNILWLFGFELSSPCGKSMVYWSMVTYRETRHFYSESVIANLDKLPI